MASEQARRLSAAIDISAGDRAPERATVFSHRINEIGPRTVCFALKRMCAFSAAPTVVTAERDLIHLFVGVLTDVRDPKIACASIEAPAPRVSQAPRVNLRAFAARTSLSRTQRIARERIRRRDPVRRARIDVDAQHLAEHRRETLAVAGVAVLVPTAAAIADADIQIAVGP